MPKDVDIVALQHWLRSEKRQLDNELREIHRLIVSSKKREAGIRATEASIRAIKGTQIAGDNGELFELAGFRATPDGIRC